MHPHTFTLKTTQHQTTNLIDPFHNAKPPPNHPQEYVTDDSPYAVELEDVLQRCGRLGLEPLRSGAVIPVIEDLVRIVFSLYICIMYLCVRV